MALERQLSCVISGSFEKSKPEIDFAIDEFIGLGVKVLAPEKGWLYRPPGKRNKFFTPLPSEVKLTLKQIEDDFLSKLSKSDFLYLISLNGYIGISSALEVGYALASRIPVFSSARISSLLVEDFEEIIPNIEVKTPLEVIEIFNTNK